MLETAPSEWFWEGNVQGRIVEYLEGQGWTVVHQSDTGRHERGPDIDARRLGRGLVVEVKGYPSDKYRDPRRANEQKPTNPRLQARHWFAAALLKVIALGDEADGWETAIGLPENDLYEELVASCERSMGALGIGIYIVREDRSVLVRLDHRSRGSALAGS